MRPQQTVSEYSCTFDKKCLIVFCAVRNGKYFEDLQDQLSSIYDIMKNSFMHQTIAAFQFKFKLGLIQESKIG